LIMGISGSPSSMRIKSTPRSHRSWTKRSIISPKETNTRSSRDMEAERNRWVQLDFYGEEMIRSIAPLSGWTAIIYVLLWPSIWKKNFLARCSLARKVWSRCPWYRRLRKGRHFFVACRAWQLPNHFIVLRCQGKCRRICKQTWGLRSKG
jgi:hypothetical protein